jgi:methyl-CpG-binding domain protein 4
VPECVADDPWKVLVAVMLLNKTAGRVAVPIFWRLIERWPSPESLAKGLFLFPFPSLRLTPETGLTADYAELEDCIRSLGLQSTRAKRLIALSSAYVEERDRPEDLLTPISHLPGSGPYALDSYRIYCGDPDTWRTVIPRDKELIRYIVRLLSVLKAIIYLNGA